MKSKSIGAERIQAKKLRKNIELKINAPLNEEELEEGAAKHHRCLPGKGFTNVDVQFQVDTDEAHGTSRVVYTINEGRERHDQRDPLRRKHTSSAIASCASR